MKRIKTIMLKKDFTCFQPLKDVVFIKLIKVKMPTIVGILTFMSMIISKLSSVEHEKVLELFSMKTHV